MNQIRRTILVIGLAGFLIGFLVHIPIFPNPNNPLLPKRSVYDKGVIEFYSRYVNQCLSDEGGKELFTCVNSIMRTVASTWGAGIALDIIQPIAQANPTLQGWGHDLSHTIGDNALYAGTGIRSGRAIKDESLLVAQIGRTIVACDGWGSFGCYHGVIEVGMSHIAPQDRARIVRKACLENPLVTAKLYYVNQCMHWFGHGMAIFTDQTLKETLTMCEGVSQNFYDDPVQLCLSGVFHAGAAPGTTDEAMLANVSRLFSPDDVYYPCNTVEERFRGHCYGHTPGRSQTGDVSVMMRNCNAIPESDAGKKDIYVRGCYESIGNNLLINAEYKADAVAAMCLESATPRYWGYCFGGAARYAGLRDPLLNNPIPFDVCRKAPISAKNTCYALVGFANFENYKSQDILQSYCAQSETGYEEACRRLNPAADLEKG